MGDGDISGCVSKTGAGHDVCKNGFFPQLFSSSTGWTLQLLYFRFSMDFLEFVGHSETGIRARRRTQVSEAQAYETISVEMQGLQINEQQRRLKASSTVLRTRLCV
jgi:hypothetical protein